MNPANDFLKIGATISCILVGAAVGALAPRPSNASGPPPVAPVAPSYEVVAGSNRVFLVERTSGKTWIYKNVRLGTNGTIGAWMQITRLDEVAPEEVESEASK